MLRNVQMLLKMYCVKLLNILGDGLMENEKGGKRKDGK